MKFNAAPENKNVIRTALDEIEDKTCIKFIQRTSEGDYVEVFKDGEYCYSMLGKQGGKQKISLGVVPTGTCVEHMTVMHEFIHALG
jgi:Astacin (Peptidase family M12A)